MALPVRRTGCPASSSSAWSSNSVSQLLRSRGITSASWSAAAGRPPVHRARPAGSVLSSCIKQPCGPRPTDSAPHCDDVYSRHRRSGRRTTPAAPDMPSHGETAGSGSRSGGATVISRVSSRQLDSDEIVPSAWCTSRNGATAAARPAGFGFCAEFEPRETHRPASQHRGLHADLPKLRLADAAMWLWRVDGQHSDITGRFTQLDRGGHRPLVGQFGIKHDLHALWASATTCAAVNTAVSVTR